MAAALTSRGSVLRRPVCWWLGHEPTNNHAFLYDGINNPDHPGAYVCPGACTRCGQGPLTHDEAFGGPTRYWRVRRRWEALIRRIDRWLNPPPGCTDCGAADRYLCDCPPF